MNYQTHDGHHLATKNKLQTAVQNYLKSIDRTLILGDDKLKLFKKSVLKKIEELNQEHSRCKPIQAFWWSSDKNDFNLSGVRFSDFNIYHSKTTY